MRTFLAILVAFAAAGASPHIHGKKSAKRDGRLADQLPKALLEKVVRASLSVAKECRYARQARQINKLLEDEVDVTANFPDVAAIQGTKIVSILEAHPEVLEKYLRSILGKFVFCATEKINAKLRKNMHIASNEKEFVAFANKVATHIGNEKYHELFSKAKEEAMKVKQDEKIAAMVMYTPTPVFSHVSGTKLVDKFLKKNKALLEELVIQSVPLLAKDVEKKVEKFGKPGWLEPYVMLEEEITEVIGEKLKRKLINEKDHSYAKLGTEIVDLFVKLKRTELLEELVHEGLARVALSETMTKYMPKKMRNSKDMKKARRLMEQIKQVVGKDYAGLKDKLKIPGMPVHP